MPRMDMQRAPFNFPRKCLASFVGGLPLRCLGHLFSPCFCLLHTLKFMRMDMRECWAMVKRSLLEMMGILESHLPKTPVEGGDLRFTFVNKFSL